MVLCYEGQDSFHCFVSLEEGLCPFLKFHFRECVVNTVLRIASFHNVFFEHVVMCSYVWFEEFVPRSLRA